MVLHEVPWITLHPVAHEVFPQTGIIHESLTHKHLSLRETLMVGHHAWFEIVIAHEVCHVGYLVLKSLLAGKHRRTCGVESFHYCVKLTGAVYAFIIGLPRLTHLVANAPHYHRGMVAVAQHHITYVLMCVVVVKRLVIS